MEARADIVVRRHGSAARFGVSVSSAAGGPHRALSEKTGRIEGAAEFLLAKVEERRTSTRGPTLLKERDLSVGTGTVCGSSPT